MKVLLILKNKSSFVTKAQLEALLKHLNQLLANEEPRDLVIPIEVRERPSLFSRVRKIIFTKSLRPSDGEVALWPRRKIILYKKAFEGNFERLMHIVLHEIGHYIDPKYDSVKEREKRANDFAEKFGYGHK